LSYMLRYNLRLFTIIVLPSVLKITFMENFK